MALALAALAAALALAAVMALVGAAEAVLLLELALLMLGAGLEVKTALALALLRGALLTSGLLRTAELALFAVFAVRAPAAPPDALSLFPQPPAANARVARAATSLLRGAATGCGFERAKAEAEVRSILPREP
jgi:hypothetical protein